MRDDLSSGGDGSAESAESPNFPAIQGLLRGGEGDYERKIPGTPELLHSRLHIPVVQKRGIDGKQYRTEEEIEALQLKYCTFLTTF